MANIRTFFAAIANFFSAVWASFICLFVFGRGADSKPCDIEAGLPDSTNREKELSTVCNVEQDVETGNGLCASSTDEFVDIDLNVIGQARKISEKRVQAKNFEHQTNDIRFDQPTRRPSSRMSAVDPVKSRILDTTLKNVQDKAIDVIKPVIITPGTVTVVACTAHVEYYHGPIIEPSGAQMEYFDDHTPSTAKVEYYHGPIIEPSSAQIEYFDGHTPSTAKVKYYHGPIVEPSSAQIEYFDAHIPSTAKVEYFEEPTSSDKIEPVDTATPESAEEANILQDQRDRSHESAAVDEPVLKPFAFNVEDVDTIDINSPVLWSEHYKTIFKDNDHESQYEISFTPLPEKKSRRVKEKRARQRESLFDIIAQFPDIPRHTPSGPKTSAIGLGNIKEGAKCSCYIEMVPQSPTSERSTSSAGSDDVEYYGSGSDDTARTSVPSSPELVGGQFTVLGKGHFSCDTPDDCIPCSSGGSHEISSSWGSDVSPSSRPLECSGYVSGKDVLPDEDSISRRSLSASDTNPQFHSKRGSWDGNGFKFPNAPKYPTGPQEEGPAEDQVIIESHKAAAYAILSAPQDDSDVSVDSLLGQLEGSSFDSMYMRPQSLVWFMDRNLRHVPTPEAISPSSAPVECSQDSVAPLRIVKKSRVMASEMFAEFVETKPSGSAKVDADRSAPVEQDEVLLQEYARWEESRQAGLKAFREAVVGDDDFYGLFYRDSCRYSLATYSQASSCHFASTSPSDSDPEMVCNDGSPLVDYIRSKESMEEFSSCYDDLSELTGVTTPEDHTTGSLSVVFDYKDLGQDNANASSELSFYADEHPPTWVATSDSDIDRVANENDNAESSFELEAF